MRVLLLLDKFLPIPQANGICISHILNYFPHCHIDVVCKVSEHYESKCVNRDNMSIYPIECDVVKNYTQLPLFGKIKYIYKHIFSVLAGDVYDEILANKYYEKCCQIINNQIPDMIIAVLNPMEAVEALYRLKKRHPSINTVLYDLDTAVFCGRGIIEKKLALIYDKKLYEWECKVYELIDLLIHLSQYKQHFSQSKYSRFEKKTIFQDIPLLEFGDTDNDKPKKKLGEISTFIYSGSFYPGLRDPELITPILDQLISNSNSKITIFTKGEYLEILKAKYQNEVKVNISEYVSQKELATFIQSSDYLLSLGNKNSNMFPSKIVDYVSALKPIIHFYQSDSDPVIRYLDPYPDKLLLDVNDIVSSNVNKILEFMNLDRVQIDKEMIRSLYKTNLSEYSAAKILDFFNYC